MSDPSLNSIIEGEGDHTFVFLHGFTLDHTMWTPQKNNFATNNRVILVDLPGHGLSPISTRPDIHDATIKIRNHLKTLIADHKIILCGLSLGGYFALEFARLFSSDLEALILVNTEVRADSEQEKVKRDKMIAKVNEGQAADIIGQVSQILISPITESEQPNLKHDLRNQMDLCPNETLVYGFQLMRNRPDYSDKLSQIKCPVLVVAGGDDKMCSFEDSQNTASAFTDASFAVIDGTGHLTPLENPIEFNQVIHEFLVRRVPQFSDLS